MLAQAIVANMYKCTKGVFLVDVDQQYELMSRIRAKFPDLAIIREESALLALQSLFL